MFYFSLFTLIAVRPSQIATNENAFKETVINSLKRHFAVLEHWSRKGLNLYPLGS
jgi:hypothetical protein